MNVRVTKIHANAKLPVYGTPGSAAFDLAACEEVTVPPRNQGLVPTGLVFCIPPDHVMLIFARSSLFGKLGLMLSNGVGVLDADYCGPEDECKILVYNPGNEPVTVGSGARIAQGMIVPRPSLTFEEGPAQGPSRGGLGSTGGHG